MTNSWSHAAPTATPEIKEVLAFETWLEAVLDSFAPVEWTIIPVKNIPPNSMLSQKKKELCAFQLMNDTIIRVFFAGDEKIHVVDISYKNFNIRDLVLYLQWCSRQARTVVNEHDWDIWEISLLAESPEIPERKLPGVLELSNRLMRDAMMRERVTGFNELVQMMLDYSEQFSDPPILTGTVTLPKDTSPLLKIAAAVAGYNASVPPNQQIAIISSKSS